MIDQMVAARGAEESTAGRQPVDLIALCAEAAAELPGLFAPMISIADPNARKGLGEQLSEGVR